MHVKILLKEKQVLSIMIGQVFDIQRCESPTTPSTLSYFLLSKDPQLSLYLSNHGRQTNSLRPHMSPCHMRPVNSWRVSIGRRRWYLAADTLWDHRYLPARRNDQTYSSKAE